MTTKEESDKVVARLKIQVEARQVIEYDRDRPDNFVPGVFWSSYGVIPTNEIMVVAKAHGEIYGIAARSNLEYPFMADRIFGMDVMDVDTRNELTDKLWQLVEQHLPKS